VTIYVLPCRHTGVRWLVRDPELVEGAAATPPSRGGPVVRASRRAAFHAAHRRLFRGVIVRPPQGGRDDLYVAVPSVSECGGLSETLSLSKGHRDAAVRRRWCASAVPRLAGGPEPYEAAPSVAVRRLYVLYDLSFPFGPRPRACRSCGSSSAAPSAAVRHAGPFCRQGSVVNAG
jgi:hypothetical protein